MADENGLAVLPGQRPLGGVDVRRQGRQRIFDKRYVVALLREDVGDGLPARLVDEGAMDENDIVRGALRRMGRLGGGAKCCSGHEDGGGRA
jgi:hypothetical protein